jgi:hypothetical protein
MIEYHSVMEMDRVSYFGELLMVYLADGGIAIALILFNILFWRTKEQAIYVIWVYFFIELQPITLNY